MQIFSVCWKIFKNKNAHVGQKNTGIFWGDPGYLDVVVKQFQKKKGILLDKKVVFEKISS